MSAPIAFPDTLWLGTENSLEVARAAYQAIADAMMAGSLVQTQAAEPDVPRLYQMLAEQSIGVVKIHGSLVNRDHWMNSYLGLTSYSAIREALIHAAQDSAAQAIVLDISSGGGDVAGVTDTAELISLIDKQVKPVYTIADAAIASAAYWLGSAARKIYAGPVSLVGSIGVLRVHSEQSKALANEGIAVKILRVGKYKALLNNLEPLTQAGEQQAMAHMQMVYDMFVEHVAAKLNMTPAKVDATIAQGREFMGQNAMDAGLVHGIGTFDTFISQIHASILDRQQVTESQYGRNIGQPMKKTFTAQQAAALAAGATAEQVAALASTEGATGAAAAATEAAAETTAATTEAAATEAQAGETQAAAAPAADAVVTLLQGQLREAQASLTTAAVQLATANARVTALEAAVTGLSGIAAVSVSNMRVALGMSALDMSASAPDVIVAEHANLAAKFASTFKAGGVAAVSAAAAAAEKPQPVQSAHQRAAVAATQFTTK